MYSPDTALGTKGLECVRVADIVLDLEISILQILIKFNIKKNVCNEIIIKLQKVIENLQCSILQITLISVVYVT